MRAYPIALSIIASLLLVAGCEANKPEEPELDPTAETQALFEALDAKQWGRAREMLEGMPELLGATHPKKADATPLWMFLQAIPVSDQDRKLFRAAIEEGDLAAVTRMLKHQPALVHPPANPDTSAFKVRRWDDTSPDPLVPPLHLAAQHNRVAMVKLMIEHGADVNAWKVVRGMENIRGISIRSPVSTPLHRAARVGSVEIAGLLLKAGAKVDSSRNFVMSPLHWAAHAGHREMVLLLLEQGTPVDIGAPRTPLVMALDREKIGDRLEAISALIQNGADVNRKDSSSVTPLHHAVRSGSLPAVKILLEAGAKVDALNNSDKTPLDLATGEIADLLRQYGTPKAGD